MRRGILGSIAALAAGAGTAWGQAPAPIAPAGGQPVAVMAGDILPASGPAPVIMPPIAVGPPGDPMGLGPVAGIGPPPGPMYPVPGPYAAPLFQPPPGGGLGGPGDGSRCAPRWWFDGEYLLWFAKSQPVRFPLLTTSAPAANGLLGQPTTIELVRAQDINYGAISGFRLSGGFYGDADRRFGALVSGFYTEQKGNDQRFGTSLGSVGIPLLARPFINTNGVSSTLVVTDTAFGLGGATVSTFTSTWGIEASGVWNLFRSAPDRSVWFSVDLLAGYKFLQNTEELRIESFTTLTGARVVPIFQPGPFGVPVQVGVRIIPSPVPVGGVVTGAPATVQVLDRIRASNRFNGGVFGVRHEARFGMWSLQTTGKIGVGNMHQVLEFQGATNFFNPATGRTGATFGGLFVNSTNIGKWNHDEFAIIPELTVNLGVNLTRSITMFVGYNFMYIDNVARPGAQVNPVVDSTTVPFSPTFGASGSPPGTRVLFVQEDFWLQGVNFGMSIRY
jgi:hypothetical protein